MPFTVYLTDNAARDLTELNEYIGIYDSPRKAKILLDNILQVISSLEESPNRGSHPKEMLAIGAKEYRQVFFKPYRVIYRVIDDVVFIDLIADGQRDMRSLLAQRLIEPGEF